jgi:hypothetical protein
MAEADLDPATGGLGDTGMTGSASPSRSRTRTAVYGTDSEPFAGGAARGKQHCKRDAAPILRELKANG